MEAYADEATTFAVDTGNCATFDKCTNPSHNAFGGTVSHTETFATN